MRDIKLSYPMHTDDPICCNDRLWPGSFNHRTDIKAPPLIEPDSADAIHRPIRDFRLET